MAHAISKPNLDKIKQENRSTHELRQPIELNKNATKMNSTQVKKCQTCAQTETRT